MLLLAEQLLCMCSHVSRLLPDQPDLGTVFPWLVTILAEHMKANATLVMHGQAYFAIMMTPMMLAYVLRDPSQPLYPGAVAPDLVGFILRKVVEPGRRPN